MAIEEKEEHFDPTTRRLDGHKYTDISKMRRGILGMCQGIGLGGDLSKQPISEEGFLETKGFRDGLSKGLKIFFPKV